MRILFLATLAVGTTAGWAEEIVGNLGDPGVSVGVADHLIVSGERVEGDNGQVTDGVFLHEADVTAEYEKFRVGIKFSNSLIPDTSDDRYRPFNLEKKLARLRLDQWDIAAGDTHHELGKGLALSLYNDPAFGVNNTLEGASIRYTPRNVQVGAFGGRINSLTAPVAINPVGNTLIGRDVWLAGGAIQGNLSDTYRLGTHYFAAFNKPNGQDFDKRWQTLGAYVERRGLMDGLSFYAESNVLLSTRLSDEGDVNQPNAYATYASMDYFPMPWRFTVEVKDYRNYRFEFRRAPALEYDLVETLNTEDVSATRLAIERRFFGLQGRGRLSHLVGEDRIKDGIFHHTVATSELPGPGRSKLQLQSGYRWMTGKENMIHAGVSAKLPTYGPQSIELGVRRQLMRQNLDFLPTERDLTNVDVTYNFSSKFNLSVGYEYLPTNDPIDGAHFANAGANLKLGQLASRAFVGQTSGGTQCSGGVCRNVPPFTGAMLESTYRF